MKHIGAAAIIVQPVNRLSQWTISRTPGNKGDICLRWSVQLWLPEVRAGGLQFFHTFVHHAEAIRSIFQDVAVRAMLIRSDWIESFLM